MQCFSILITINKEIIIIIIIIERKFKLQKKVVLMVMVILITLESLGTMLLGQPVKNVFNYFPLLGLIYIYYKYMKTSCV